MNCPTCNVENAEVSNAYVKGQLTSETAKMLHDLNNGKLTWNQEYRKIFIPLIKGQPITNVLANFCGRCGADLRPYHDEIKKHSLHLKPFPKD